MQQGKLHLQLATNANTGEYFPSKSEVYLESGFFNQTVFPNSLKWRW